MFALFLIAAQCEEDNEIAGVFLSLYAPNVGPIGVAPASRTPQLSVG